jgi:hypothetical protein
MGFPELINQRTDTPVMTALLEATQVYEIFSTLSSRIKIQILEDIRTKKL